MTIQMSDILIDEGGRHFVWSFPLESYFKHHPRPAFDDGLTCLDRGYEAIWEIDGVTDTDGSQGRLGGRPRSLT